MNTEEYGPIEWPKFLMFGDSITQMTTQPGFSLFSTLQDDYIRKMDIVNRGFGGYTTRHAIKLIRNIYDQLTHDDGSLKLAYVFFGSNDCALNSTQTVPVDEYAANLKILVNFLLEKNVKVIVVGNAVMNKSAFDNRPNESSWKFNRAAQKVANELNVAFVDLYTAFLRAAGIAQGDETKHDLDDPANPTAYLLTDGLHFSADGYKIFHKELTQSIEQNYPELQPNNLRDAVENHKI